MARKASRQSVSSHLAEWVERLPESFISCRDLGHKWNAYTARWDSGHNAYQRTLRCPRCHTERHQMLSPSGHVLSNSYSHPDGYLAPKGHGHVTASDKDTIRLHGIVRQVEQTEAKERAA